MIRHDDSAERGERGGQGRGEENRLRGGEEKQIEKEIREEKKGGERISRMG